MTDCPDQLVVELMTFNTVVPLAVPSEIHGSKSLFSPFRVYINNLLFVTPYSAKSLPIEPGYISFTSTVPAEVPSVFHSSDPCAGSVARKYVTPFINVNWSGALEAPVVFGSE